MATYKLRAECTRDVRRLLADIPKRKLKRSNILQGAGITVADECELELEVEIALPQLQLIIAGVEDGHVMLETVARIEDYTGERKTVHVGFLPMAADPIAKLLPSTRRSLRPR